MPVAVIDGLKVNYHMQGSGPHLLMLAPGGFSSTIESWTRGGVWKEMDSRPLRAKAAMRSTATPCRRAPAASNC